MHDERRCFPAPPAAARALVLTAHPCPDSFNHALADAWTEGAGALPTDHLDVHTLQFDPVLRRALRADQPLEPDLLRAKHLIEHAAHVVLAFPVWWSSTPAALKGFFDRLLLPGWAYAYQNGRPIGGLGGRSARTLITMDAPVWYDTVFNGAAARRQVHAGTLAFCGLAPVRTNVFGSIGTTDAKGRSKLLERARAAGAADAAAVLRRFPAALADHGAVQPAGRQSRATAP